MLILQLSVVGILRMLFVILVIALIIFYYESLIRTKAGEIMYHASGYITWPVRRPVEKAKEFWDKLVLNKEVEE